VKSTRKDIAHHEQELFSEYIIHKSHASVIAKKIQILSQSKSVDMLHTVSSEILAISYLNIKLCSLYPDRKPETYMERRVKGMIISRDIKYIPARYIRYHLSMIACFNLMIRYVRKGRMVDIRKFMLYNLPLYYIKEIEKETKQTQGPMFIPTHLTEPTIILPASGKDYIANYIKTNVSKYAREFFTIMGRKGVYRIMEKMS